MINFTIRINNKELTLEQKKHVSNLKVKKVSTGASSVDITINDPLMNFIGDPSMFREDVPVTIIIKYKNDSLTFKGYVAQLDLDFPETGIPNISLTVMDESYKLDRKKKTKNWGTRKRHEIAKEIFTSYGLKTVISPSVNKPDSESDSEVSQSNETDIDFLTKLAEEEAEEWLCYVSENTGYYCRKDLMNTPQATLGYKTYGGNIKSFKPTIDKVTKRVEVYQQDIGLLSGDIVTLNNYETKNTQGK